MGYQLDLYSLSWPALEETWFRERARPFAERVALDGEPGEEFIGAIRDNGKLLCSLDHTSSDAKNFLERFLGKVAPRAFSEPRLQEQLMERGLFGLAGVPST